MVFGLENFVWRANAIFFFFAFSNRKSFLLEGFQRSGFR